ncbi:MAG: hypothetical protein CMJ78_01915 [Planctomycetaceae bacterium]|nr:hypothetical protein [Planctomycetaceae bacterium]
MEKLEDRTLLAVSALFVNGNELNIAVDADDTLIIREDSANPGTVEVLGNGAPVGNLPTINASAVEQIIVQMGDGDATIDLSGVTGSVFDNPAISLNVTGGDGDDNIIGSPDLADNISSGDGDDTVNGGGGNDTIDAGNGADLVVGGTGDDNIIGDDGMDTITGGLGNDTIDSGDGADSVDGGMGDDNIIAGDDDAVVNGGDGMDTIDGDSGADTLNGDADNDRILGGADNDFINGGDGDDFLNGQLSDDVINGGLGNDTLEGGGNDDQLFGGSGDDNLAGSAGNDTLEGGQGDDSLFGGSGRDQVFGDSLSPLVAGAGNDVVMGQGGADTVNGGGGSDTIEGGEGNDVVQSGDLMLQALNQLTINDVTVVEGDAGADQLFSGELAFPTVNDATPGIVAADFDGDGMIDLATPGSVLLNTGGGMFGAPIATGATGSGYMDVGDVNGDGLVDLVIPANDVQIVLNQGGGMFAAPVTINQGTFFNPSAVNLADYDGDGDLDIGTVVGFGNNNLMVQLNDGMGNFGAVVSFPAGTSGSSDLVSTDLDGDGDLDVVVTKNFLQANVSFLRNNGNGTFAPSIETPVTSSPSAIVAGDFNGDGIDDLATVGGQISILTNDGGGNFTETQSFASGGFFGDNDIEAMDLDGDGDVDLVSTGFGGEVSVILNDGTGTFFTPFAFNTVNGSFDDDIVIADIDANGTPDIAINNGFAQNQITTVLNSGITPVTATLTVSLSQVSTTDVTVDFTTADGIATAGSDYLASRGRLTIPAGMLAAQTSVQFIGETTAEPDENLFINLSNISSGVVLADDQGQITIVDDDMGTSGPTISVLDAVVMEGDTGQTTANVTLSISAAPTANVAIDFATADGLAFNGADYVETTGTMTFTPTGPMMQTISVPIIGDIINEGDEDFFINLSDPTGTVIMDSNARVTITDDDQTQGAVIPDDTLRGGSGNDTVVASFGADFIAGGSGNDNITASDGNDRVFGGGGDDFIDGGAGDDRLDGQSGNDTLEGGEGAEVFIWDGARDDTDTISNSSGTASVDIRGQAGGNSFSVGQANGLMTITDGMEVLTIGTTIKDIVLGGGTGDDMITVEDLTGVIISSLTVDGQGGADTIDASGATLGNVRLRINGGAGNDTVTGSAFSETIDGGTGDDNLSGGAGNDVFLGGDGDDIIMGGDGNDLVDGQAGDDTIRGDNGDDNLAGGEDDDDIEGGNDNDTIQGMSGNDKLNGKSGNDSVLGGDDEDTLFGGMGDDTLDGGSDNDIVRGSRGNDKLRGGDGDDTLRGEDGDDTMNGGDGDDSMLGGAGNDIMAGMDGVDKIIGNSGADTMSGGDGNDNLLGGGGNDVIVGDQGDDFINGQGGADTVGGGEGTDARITDALDTIDETFILSAALIAELDAV